MSAPLRHWSRRLGQLLTLICVGFVAWRLWQLAPAILEQSEWPALLFGIFVSTPIYVLGSLLLAIAWWQLLRSFADPNAQFLPAAADHMRAQLAKYLPGNVFHFAARHVRARRSGLGHLNLASAALAESLLLVTVAIVIAQAVPTADLPVALQLLARWRLPILACAAIGLVVGLRFLQKRSAHGPAILSFRIGVRGMAAAAACYLLFFCLAAFAFANLVGTGNPDPAALLSMIAVSWLGGFLVMGAPGGVGVREALLMALLGPLLGDAQALIAALAFRIVTVLADVAVYLIGLAVRDRSD